MNFQSFFTIGKGKKLLFYPHKTFREGVITVQFLTMFRRTCRCLHCFAGTYISQNTITFFFVFPRKPHIFRKIEITLVKKCSDRQTLFNVKTTSKYIKLIYILPFFIWSLFVASLVFLHFAGIYAGVVEKLAYLFNYEYGGN